MGKKYNKIYLVKIAVGFIFLLLFVLTVGTVSHIEDLVDVENANGEIVVIFENEISEQELKLVVSSIYSSAEILRHIEDYALIYVKNDKDYTKVMNGLRNTPQVKAVQANNSIAVLNTSNDPYADSQWAIHNPGRYTQYAGAAKNVKISIEGIDMEVLKAWQQLNKGTKELREVVVAIIDTGVDFEHPDLVQNMWFNCNEIPGDGIDNDGNGYIDDIYGWDFYNKDATVCHYEYDTTLKTNVALPEDNDDHGTHIAGIIAATANNKIGIAGIASNVNVKIMALKINGGPNGTGSVSNAIEAIKYATMMGADICNLSWGTQQYSEALELVIKESDMLFVAAAGNSGSNNNSSPIYPASYQLDNLISVTFINPNGKLNTYANYGPTTVDLAAPGEDILSTVVGAYATMTGSSMAAPHVSAVAAMLYSYSDDLFPSNVKEILMGSIKPLDGLEGNMKYPGIPNAYKTVMASESLMKDSSPPMINLETIINKGEFIIPIHPEDKGGSGVRVIKYMIGERELSAFQRGVSGTRVVDNKVTLVKPGLYTFYVSDYAGNSTIVPYKVFDDITPPKISPTYTVSKNYKTRTVTVRVSDNESGVKRVKFMEGRKNALDFLPAGAGNEIELVKGKGTFKVNKDGIYTIFASDNRGNHRVYHLNIKVIPIKEMKFLRSQKPLYIGEQYATRVIVKPTNTTDKLSYVSSNKSVATVDVNGKVTALKEGKAIITVKSNSGVKAVCEIRVKKE